MMRIPRYSLSSAALGRSAATVVAAAACFWGSPCLAQGGDGDGGGARAPVETSPGGPEETGAEGVAERGQETGASPGARGLEGAPRPEGYGRDRWESLTDEEKERLRAGLREVWTDPQVISAREEVQQATEAYRKAVREAMGRLDPSTVPLVREMQQEGEGRSRERLGGGRPEVPGPSGSRGRGRQRGSEWFSVGPPGFLERFPEEEQERFRKAEAVAQQAEQVVVARDRLAALRERDETLRRERFEAHLNLRRSLIEAILAEDPGLGEMVEALRSRAAASPPGKGEEPEGDR